MITHKDTAHKLKKQRLTAFVNPILVKRAKIQGALEGLTISEIIEKALEVYAPIIESGSIQDLHLKFINGKVPADVIPETHKQVPKHTKDLSVPRR